MIHDLLIGREQERRHLERLVAATAGGRGAGVVVEGDIGIGKSVLLAATAALAREHGLVVVELVGRRSAAATPFADVVLLLEEIGQLGPLRDRCERSDSPAVRRDVAVAVHRVLAVTAARRPLVVLVDQADSVDPASLEVLAHVASRTAGTPLLVVLTRTTGDDAPPLDDLPRMAVGGLTGVDARHLLRDLAAREVEPAVADQIAVATGGNPAAIRDLARELSPWQLRGLEPLPEPLPAGRTIERRYAARIGLLDPATRQWMLVAAADGTRSTVRTFAAARHLGLSPEVSAEVEQSGLVRIGLQVRFTSELVASCVYHTATLDERRRVHRALARAAEDADADAEVARHLAAQMLVEDEGTASALEAMADQASYVRGQDPVGLVLRAANLTPDAGRRVERVLRAARLALAHGQLARAAAIAAEVESGPTFGAVDDRVRARALLVSAHSCLDPEQPDLLLRAPALCSAAVRLLAEAAGPSDVDELGHALMSWAAMLLDLGPRATRADVRDLTEQLAVWRRGIPTGVDPGATEPLLVAVAALLADGPVAAATLARRALARCHDPDDRVLTTLPGTTLALTCAAALWDHSARVAIIDRAQEAARSAGLPLALRFLLAIAATADARLGLVPAARRTFHEARVLGLSTVTQDGVLRAAGEHDREPVPGLVPAAPVHPRLTAGGSASEHATIELLAWEDAGPVALEVLHAAAVVAEEWGHAQRNVAALRATVLAHLGGSRWIEAAEVARAMLDTGDLRTAWPALPDAVEAFVRAGRYADAQEVLDRLVALAAVAPSDYLAAMLARSRALVGIDVDASYRTSVALLTAPDFVVEQARSRLLHGEWLRRTRRTSLAVQELELARAVLHEHECHGFARRAAREAAVAGGPAGADGSVLTAQEHEVAARAAAGATNAEIAGALFLSRHTVDYHLRKVFQKLAVSSRRDLADALGRPPG